MRHDCHFIRLTATALCVAVAGTVFAGGDGVVDGAAGHAGVTRQKTSGKATSGVIVRQSVPEQIAIGETVVLRLHFSGVTAADGATVEIRDPSTRAALASVWLAQGERRTIDLPYVGRSDGMQFIDITTTQAGRNTVQSVPLRVGSGELVLKREGRKLQSTAGDNVISLPAVEPGATR